MSKKITDIFSSEKWRRYWIGKTEKTRKAVEYYLSKYKEGQPVSSFFASHKFGIKKSTLNRHIVNLRKYGLVKKSAYLHRKGKIMTREQGLNESG